MRTDANLDEKIETDWCQQTTILQEKLVLIGKGFLMIFPNQTEVCGRFFEGIFLFRPEFEPVIIRKR